MIISFFQYFNFFSSSCLLQKKRPAPATLFYDQKGKRNEQKQEEQDKEVRYSRRILSMKRRTIVRTPAKKDSKHLHLQFASRRRRLHQHRVLVSLRGHFQALQRRTLQRDRRRFRRRRFGAGGFYATHARSSCGGNSGVIYNRSAQRQRRHPLWV